MLLLEVRPEAELDALEAASWYDGERDGLGMEFLAELRATFIRIEERPLRFPLVFRDFRRAILHRFPFGVFFIVEAEIATVLAITHLHRDPSVWQTRTSNIEAAQHGLDPTARNARAAGQSNSLARLANNRGASKADTSPRKFEGRYN